MATYNYNANDTFIELTGSNVDWDFLCKKYLLKLIGKTVTIYVCKQLFDELTYWAWGKNLITFDNIKTTTPFTLSSFTFTEVDSVGEKSYDPEQDAKRDGVGAGIYRIAARIS